MFISKDNVPISVCFCVFIITLSISNLSSQNTLALLNYEPWNNSYEGYNLIYPHNQPNVYLLDNCGRLINSWEDEEDFKPGNTAYITTDGNLVKTKRKSADGFGFIYDTTGEAYVECRDWDNNLLWQFSYVTEEGRLHHDIELTPQGTVLMIAWDHYSIEDALDKGRLSEYMDQDAFSPDKIMEYDPVLDSIIWEWKAWDHIVQDVDSSKDNYGVIADHPRRININYENNFNRADWMHLNSIDYHPGRDHIMINVPTFNEIWIIDHSTTTEEAASSNGGNAGHGGDLLWRWGNPTTYNSGGEVDQKLFFQHDALWTIDYLGNDDLNINKVTVFNNRWSSSQSAVGIIDIPYVDSIGYPLLDGHFLPEDFEYNWTLQDEPFMYSSNMSSMQILPNGNHLICAGRDGYSFEYDPLADKIVWEYRTPIRNGFIATQGEDLAGGVNSTFRIRRYPLDFSGFEGKDLQPQMYLEINPNVGFCDDILPLEEISQTGLHVFPNPVDDILHVKSDILIPFLLITDIHGKPVYHKEAVKQNNIIDIAHLPTGVYILHCGNGENQKIIKH